MGYDKIVEDFNRRRLPDVAVVEEKSKRIISGTTYDKEDNLKKLTNIERILKELESLGVYTGNIDEFPDFDDIVGRKELKDIVMASVIRSCDWLREDIANTSGVLLYGEPGTGKTHFVKAAAKELEKIKGKGNVIYLEVSDIESPYVGETSRRIKRITEKVKELKKAGKEVVLVIDEVDRLAPNRTKISGSGKLDTITSLLTSVSELQKEGVHIFAMTNDPNMVDRAFSDRMSVKQHVGLPTKEELKIFLDSAILKDNYRNVINLDDVSQKLESIGASFRDTKSFLNILKIKEAKSGTLDENMINEALEDIKKSKENEKKTFLK